MKWNYLSQKYFDWIINKVWDNTISKGPNYHRFFAFLFDAPFIPSIELDEPRVSDAINLRYVFADANGISYSDVEAYLNDGTVQCSMLEMMVALSIRMEEHLLSDNDFGNRTGQWFWQMVMSLGFANVDDSQFNEGAGWSIVDRFNRREYGPNGNGGLFTISNPRIDMRNFDIWYQMQNWISEKCFGGI